MSNGIIGAAVRLLVGLCPDFLGAVRDLLEKLGGASGQMWFVELKKFLTKKPCWLPNILRIDRSKSFDPVKFLGEGWSIVEEDERSLALTEIDPTKIQLETVLKEGEKRIQSEEKFKRLKKTGYIRLDARIFQTLWGDQSLIPEIWKVKTDGNTSFIYFDGTEFRRSVGGRAVLFLCWNDGRWDWGADRLDVDWYPNDPSAVLAE